MDLFFKVVMVPRGICGVEYSVFCLFHDDTDIVNGTISVVIQYTSLTVGR